MSTTFRHVSEIGATRLTDNLGLGIVQFINQCYLNIGGFSKIDVPASGVYGGDFSRLRPVSSPYYSGAQVWEGARSNWVFEDDVVYAITPSRVSGVHVNGVFQPSTGVGTYAHYINYPYGAVIFDSPLPTNSIVKCAHSFKNVNVYADDAPFVRTFMTDSMRVDHPNYNQYGSGIWNNINPGRVQLPAIIVQPIQNVSLEGIEIGGHNKRYQDVHLHVFAEIPTDKNFICDDLINQKDAIFLTYDRDAVNAADRFPLDYRGAVFSSGIGYESLINNYAHRRCVITNVGAREFSKVGGLYYALIRWTVEIYI